MIGRYTLLCIRLLEVSGILLKSIRKLWLLLILLIFDISTFLLIEIQKTVGYCQIQFKEYSKNALFDMSITVVYKLLVAILFFL